MNNLKQLPQWVGWKTVIKKNKLIKMPINPYNGRAASSTDPTTWATAEDAWKVKKRYRLSGIGFVFTLEAGVVGIDLDNVFDEDGRYKPEPEQVMQCMESYTELSPSGTGIHIFARGEIPSSIKKNKRGFEMYNQGRFFTVTGDRIGLDEIANRQAELMALWVTFGEGYQEPAPVAAKKTYSDVTAEKIRYALTFIPQQLDYEDWLKILMAVHSEYPNSLGIELAESWSPGYPGEVEQKFKSFKNGSKVTINSLFYYARQYGYTLPPSGDNL